MTVAETCFEAVAQLIPGVSVVKETDGATIGFPRKAYSNPILKVFEIYFPKGLPKTESDTDCYKKQFSYFQLFII